MTPRESDLRVLTIAEVAQMIGWPVRRTHRYLTSLDRQLGRSLLRDVGRAGKPRWTLTIGALRAACPEWFASEPSVRTVE